MRSEDREVRIMHLLKEAPQAGGTAVVIDVFRAFTVEGFVLAGNAAKLIPVAEEEKARSFPDAVRIGERRGYRLPGFDYGNSPSAVQHVDFSGKTVVHTTSAGTQGIAACMPYAYEVLAAALTNARATAEYIVRSGAKTVSLLAMGLMGERDTEEDLLCARYIQALILGEDTGKILAEVPSLRYTEGRKFFDPLQQDRFPQADFGLCIDTDRFPFAMKVIRDVDEYRTVRIDL